MLYWAVISTRHGAHYWVTTYEPAKSEADAQKYLDHVVPYLRAHGWDSKGRVQKVRAKRGRV